MSNVPKAVCAFNNKSYNFYQMKLLKMIYSIFTFKGLPADWNEPYFKENLFRDGYICVTDTAAGVLALRSGYNGINVYNQPTNFIITNPVLGTVKGVLGKDGEFINLGFYQDGFNSARPIVERYATLLAEVDASLMTTLINSRIAVVFSAETDGQLKAMMKIYDQITAGNPAVFKKKGIEGEAEHAQFSNVKQTFIGTELLDTKRTILNEFLTEIGINNANTDKKERLVVDEVNANNDELESNVSEWYLNLKTSIEKVNKLYGLNISVEFNATTGPQEKPVKEVSDAVS